MASTPSSSSSARPPAGPKKGQTQLYFSWDGTQESVPNASLLRRFLAAKGYYIHEHAGEVFGNGSVTAVVPAGMVETLRACTVFLVCVSKEYTKVRDGSRGRAEVESGQAGLSVRYGVCIGMGMGLGGVMGRQQRVVAMSPGL